MKYDDNYTRRAMQQFPDVVKMYLENIDVHMEDCIISQEYSAMSVGSGTCFEFVCRAEESDFKYFEDFSKEISRDNFPLINKEAVMRANATSMDASEFNCFNTETIIKFAFSVPALSVGTMNNFMHILKTKTEPLQYKKFSENIDKEITEELGE